MTHRRAQTIKTGRHKHHHLTSVQKEFLQKEKRHAVLNGGSHYNLCVMFISQRKTCFSLYWLYMFTLPMHNIYLGGSLKQMFLYFCIYYFFLFKFVWICEHNWALTEKSARTQHSCAVLSLWFLCSPPHYTSTSLEVDTKNKSLTCGKHEHWCYFLFNFLFFLHQLTVPASSGHCCECVESKMIN